MILAALSCFCSCSGLWRSNALIWVLVLQGRFYRNDFGSTIMIYAGVVVILSMDIGLLFTGVELIPAA